jgi:Domain of Unknown Function (DUF1259)
VLAQSGLQPVNIDGISAAMGRQGDRAGEMYKVSFPRSDLNVKVANLAIKPALSLVAWAAFIKSGDTATTYGDLVLLDEEINPVISKLEERGIEVAALHNHLLHENPRIMYIHFVGRGDEVAMAKGIREAIGLTKTPWLPRPPPARRRNRNLPRRSSGSSDTRATWEAACFTSSCRATMSTWRRRAP